MLVNNLATPMYYYSQISPGPTDLQILHQWLGTNLQQWVDKADLKTGVVVVAAVLVLVAVVDLLTKSTMLKTVDPARTIDTAAPNDQQHEPAHHQPIPGSRSLESLTKVLDALTKAAAKWEGAGSGGDN